MTYSRPSWVKPPIHYMPRGRVGRREPEVSASPPTARSRRVDPCGSNRGTGSSGRTRRFTWSASEPSRSLTTSRATVCMRILSSSDIWSLRRTKMPPGWSTHIGLAERGDDAHDLVVQRLAVSRGILVPDHQVHGYALQSPVGVGLNHLSDQNEVFVIRDAHKHDGQVARDAVGPQSPTGRAGCVRGHSRGARMLGFA